MEQKERLAGNDFVLLTGSSNPKLAEDVGKILWTQVCHIDKWFDDGAPDVRILETVRRRDVIILQSVSPPDINGYFEQLKDILDASKRVSAREIIAIIPYFPYARSDRMNRERSPISGGKAAVEIVEAGADHLVTVDLHSEQLQGSLQGIYKRPWDNLYASYCLVPAVKKLKLDDIIIASPDRGGSERAYKYRDFFNSDDGVAIFYKIRDKKTRKPTVDQITGDVGGKNVIFVDDIIDSAKTLVGAANYAQKLGAKSIIALATHGLFTGNALGLIEDSFISKVYTTDTVPQRNEVLKHPKIKIVSVAPLLAEGIKRIYSGESIQNLFLSTL